MRGRPRKPIESLSPSGRYRRGVSRPIGRPPLQALWLWPSGRTRVVLQKGLLRTQRRHGELGRWHTVGKPYPTLEEAVKAVLERYEDTPGQP